MKQIVKDDEPLDFAEWKAGDRMAHRPNWNRVPGPVRQSIHESLLREQGEGDRLPESAARQGSSKAAGRTIPMKLTADARSALWRSTMMWDLNIFRPGWLIDTRSR